MLEEYRKKIDEIDNEIIDLLLKRSEIASKIAHEKKINNSVLYKPDREQAILQKVGKKANSYIDSDSLQNIYREIMSGTLKNEGGMSIGYFGSIGSFTHEAALKKFGHSLELIPFKTIEDVFDHVQRKKINFGVVPIENSQEGIVNETIDNLIEFKINIYAEIQIPIKQNLITTAENLSQIEKVYTHWQAHRQCKKFIKTYLPNAEWIETTSTSKAVEFISQEKNNNLAAIGSHSASEFFKIPILKEGISDYNNNYTRFIILGLEHAKPSKYDRTSIIFGLDHKPGTLHLVLKPISDAKVNLSCIESRPSKNSLWNYIFYLEFEGHQDSKKIKKLIDSISKITQNVRILGSYPIDKVI